MYALDESIPIHVVGRNKRAVTVVRHAVVERFTYRNFSPKPQKPRDPRLALLALEQYVEAVMKARATTTHEPIFLAVVDICGERLPRLTDIIAKWRPNYNGRSYVRNPEVIAELKCWRAFHLEIAARQR